MIGASDRDIAFTIGTLVTDTVMYAAMRETFAAHGFDGPDCEFIAIDNCASASQTDAYRGLNDVLDRARGRIVILCHQDVRLIGDGRADLELRLRDMDAIDPAWAVLGNAGGTRAGQLALRLTDPHGDNRTVGLLPARVLSLDENFLVVRRNSRIGFSRDLSGFHFYGADLCLVADIMGYTSYVIDFHLQHLSPGRKSTDFWAAREAFRRKWSHALRPRWMQTTCGLVHLNGGWAAGWLGKHMEWLVSAVSRRLPSARGWSGRTARVISPRP